MLKTIQLPYRGPQAVEVSISRTMRRSALRVPPVAIGAVLTGPVEVSLVDLEVGDGNTTLLEQLVILSLARAGHCRRAFELGTFDGKTSANLSANLPHAEIATIDLPASGMADAALPISDNDRRYIEKESIGARLGRRRNVVQLYGDTATFDFSPWRGTQDFVFVDACHEYEYALNDSEAALDLLAPGGQVLWHDYGVWPGVTRALNELYGTDPRFASLRHIAGTSLCRLAADPAHADRRATDRSE